MIKTKDMTNRKVREEIKRKIIAIYDEGAPV
jgi:hypothetical protein